MMMTETIIYIILACTLVASAHIWSAIKSGCFYSVSRKADPVPSILKKYVQNIHYAQTPFWYSLFGAFGIMLFAMCRIIHPNELWYSLLASYLIMQGTSTLAGPFYQGFINVGCGKSFIDSEEPKSMQLADPISGKTVWIKRFWYGKRRIYLAFVGLFMIVLGIYVLSTM